MHPKVTKFDNIPKTARKDYFLEFQGQAEGFVQIPFQEKKIVAFPSRQCS